MFNQYKNRDFIEKNRDRKISTYASQTLFDIMTLNIMSVEYSQDELIDVILSKFGSSEPNPFGKRYTSDAKLQTRSGALELWLSTGYNGLRIKNMIVHLNTILESYLYNIFKIWLEKKPEILKERLENSMTSDENDKQDILTEVTSKYIRDMLYGDYSRIFNRVKEKININLEVDPPILQKIDIFYEIRNILVHSNGIISKKLIELSPESNFKIGEYIYLNSQYVEDSELLIADMVLLLDNGILEVFLDIDTMDFSEFETLFIESYTT